LLLTAQTLHSNGDVIAEGNFKLFDGASEATHGLDGQRTFQILANNPSQSRCTSRLVHDEEEGDYAIANKAISTSQLRIE